MLNLQESFVKFSPNIQPDQKQTYEGILWMEDQSSLGKYLGETIDIQGSKVHYFTPLLDIRSQPTSHVRVSALCLSRQR